MFLLGVCFLLRFSISYPVTGMCDAWLQGGVCDKGLPAVIGKRPPRHVQDLVLAGTDISDILSKKTQCSYEQVTSFF